MANLITGQTHHYGLGKAARSWEGSAFMRGLPPETKPDYVEPLWLVCYADAWLKLEARP